MCGSTQGILSSEVQALAQSRVQYSVGSILGMADNVDPLHTTGKREKLDLRLTKVF